jgi:hypothetical protein
MDAMWGRSPGRKRLGLPLPKQVRRYAEKESGGTPAPGHSS